MMTAAAPAAPAKKFSLFDLQMFTAILVEDCHMHDGARAQKITFQLSGDEIDKLIQVNETIAMVVEHKDTINAAIKSSKARRK